MKLLLLTAILVHNFQSINNLSINELIIPDHQYANYTKFFVNLIQVYNPTYHNVYHLGSKSKDVYDETISSVRKSKLRTTFSVFNYDEMNIKEFKRPDASRILHVVYTVNPKNWAIFTQPYKVLHRDVVIFITINNETEKYRTADAVKLSGKVLLIQITNSSLNGILLSQICYYCGNISQIIRPIKKKAKNTTLLPYNYKNLNGQEMRLAFTTNYPFIYCDKFVNIMYGNDSMKHCLKLDGIESHMVREISRKMNFKFKAYTEEKPSTSFFNMLASITEKKYDFAFGSISVTLSRRKIIQYTIPYHVEKYYFLYRVSRSFPEVLKTFFAPFSDVTAWIIFYSAQVLVVVLLTFIGKFEPVINGRKKISDCVFLLLQIQLEQSTTTVSAASLATSPKFTSLKFITSTKYTSFLFLLWCLACLVLSSAFKGVSLLTLLRPPRTEPQEIAELLERGYGVAANMRSRDIVIDLMYGLPFQSDIYYHTNNCEVFHAAQTSKLAMLNEWSTFQFHLKKACPTMDPQTEEQMRLARRAVRTAGHAWATQRGAPYRLALDYYLSLILSGGLYVKWTQDHTSSISKQFRPFRLSRETQKNMHAGSLSMYAFYPVFAVYLLGILVSFICFLCEIIFYYSYKKC